MAYVKLSNVCGHSRRPSYTDEQWDVLRALLRTLKLAVAQLQMVFRAERVIDFMELGIAAREALGKIDNPTEVAYRMDSRIEHLLVDEFQDTSRAQFELLEQLTGGWQPGDGRTLFLVGDPMQSIYRFRQAEVGLFGEVERKGIGGLAPGTLATPLEPPLRPGHRRARESTLPRQLSRKPSTIKPAPCPTPLHKPRKPATAAWSRWTASSKVRTNSKPPA